MLEAKEGPLLYSPPLVSLVSLPFHGLHHTQNGEGQEVGWGVLDRGEERGVVVALPFASPPPRRQGTSRGGRQGLAVE